MPTRQKDLILKEKVNVIEYAAEYYFYILYVKVNRYTQLELAKKFQVSQAQVSKLLK